MRLTRIGDLRRRELRRAAFHVMQSEGAAGTTLEKVAAHAGASKGIVLHYFGSKQALFEHAMREANAQLRDVVIERLKRATSPLDRIFAIIDGNFEEHLFQPSICHGWLSLCAEVPRNKNLARIQKVLHARMRSNLLSGLKDITDCASAEEIVMGVSTLIDGFWLRLGLHPGSISREQAIAQTRHYVLLSLENGSATSANLALEPMVEAAQ